jgi:hypothetical protein
MAHAAWAATLLTLRTSAKQRDDVPVCVLLYQTHSSSHKNRKGCIHCAFAARKDRSNRNEESQIIIQQASALHKYLLW